MKRSLLIIFLIIATNILYSQQPVHRQFTPVDGLPSSEVYYIMQDSKGYIWFATNNGVSRFDGYQFKNFGIPEGLPDATVFDLHEDHKGRIWIIPLSLNLSYFQDDSIHVYKNNQEITDNLELPLSSVLKNSFYVDSSDNIYFSILGRHKTIKITPDGSVSFPVKTIYNSYGFIEVENKKIFFDGSLSSTYFKYGDQSIHNIIKLTDQKYCTGCSNNEYTIFSNGEYLYLFKKGVYINTHKFSHDILWLSINKLNELFIGTRNGFFIIKDISNLKNKQKYLENFSISSITRDSENNLWVSTLSDGIFQFPNTSFKLYDNLKNSKNIKALHSKYKKIFISFRPHGLAYFNTQNPTTIKDIDAESPEVYEFKTFKNDTNIYYSNSNGIFKLKPPFKREEICNIGKYLIYKGTIQSEFKNCKSFDYFEDILYYGTSNGLFKISNKNLEYLGVRSRIYDLFVFNHSLYMATANGLYSLKNKKITYLGKNLPLLQYRINSLDSLNSSSLLIGTKGIGLVIFNTETNSIKQITNKEGISSNSINKIKTINDSVIWLATNQGLTKISINPDITINYIERFDNSNGLPSTEINDLALFNNYMYLATNNGLIVFDINDITVNKKTPPIYINNVSLGNKILTKKDKYNLKGAISLLTIDYMGLSYLNREDLRYKYRMIGIDTSWTETKERIIQFASLQPGSYKFEVKAKSRNGIWSKEPATIVIKVTPPFYKTLWFKILGILSLVAIVSIFFKFRISEIKKKNELLLTINEHKQRILRQQMNPHFIFNTLNSIQFYLLEQNIDSSIEYLSKFAKLMRMILENTQKTYISLQDEIEALRLYLELEALRFENKISFNIKIDPEINTLEYKIPSLLLQPFCENSIKHGLAHKDSGGRISIEFLNRQETILCIIEDNGVGRLKSTLLKQSNNKTHKSLGTKISAERVRILNNIYNKEISIKYIDQTNNKGESTGTRVEISLPILR